MAKKGIGEHPKTLDLAAELRVDAWGAVGILELLWHFTSQYARQGDVGKHRVQKIADSIRWKGKPDRLIEALWKTGWVDVAPDVGLVIHDWNMHCEDLVRKNLGNNGETFWDGSEPLDRTKKDHPFSEKLLFIDGFVSENDEGVGPPILKTHRRAHRGRIARGPSLPNPSRPLPAVHLQEGGGSGEKGEVASNLKGRRKGRKAYVELEDAELLRTWEWAVADGRADEAAEYSAELTHRGVPHRVARG